LHAGGVEVGREGIGLGIGGGNARRAEKIETELHGIFSSGVSKLVREGLENPREGIAAWSAKRVSGNAKWH
jgi:hypothetical protein